MVICECVRYFRKSLSRVQELKASMENHGADAPVVGKGEGVGYCARPVPTPVRNGTDMGQTACLIPEDSDGFGFDPTADTIPGDLVGAGVDSEVPCFQLFLDHLV